LPEAASPKYWLTGTTWPAAWTRAYWKRKLDGTSEK
jgi:hypothetical protein